MFSTSPIQSSEALSFTVSAGDTAADRSAYSSGAASSGGGAGGGFTVHADPAPPYHYGNPLSVQYNHMPPPPPHYPSGGGSGGGGGQYSHIHHSSNHSLYNTNNSGSNSYGGGGGGVRRVGSNTGPITTATGGGGHAQRLHHDFKALSKDERKRLVEQEAAASDLLARTVHLRFLPTSMLQSELAEICTECGPYLRVRICGNSTNNQNWIYGFVEFATKEGAVAMMKKCGMELSNGPGRPPLRLKCNCAKQPIVDRVFHDADTATNTPCIFGLGNFAHRSIKDALDSYFNLKEKEAAHHHQQQQLGGGDGDSCEGPLPADDGPTGGYLPVGTNNSAYASGLGTAGAARSDATATPGAASSLASMTPSLSPHAKAFTPNPGAAAFVPSSLNIGAAAMMMAHVSPGFFSGSGTGGLSPGLRAVGKTSSTTASDGSETSTKGGHMTFATTATTSNNNSALSYAPLPGTAAAAHGYGMSTSTIAGGYTPPFTAAGNPLVTPYGERQASDSSLGNYGMNLTPTFTTATLNNSNSAVAANAYAFDSLFRAASMTHNVGGGAAGYSPSVDALLLPPAATATATTATEAAASHLTLALQAMMESSDLRLQQRIAEAEEVLQRGRALLSQALGQCKRFSASGCEGFFDAVGTLKSILELLERNAATFTSGTTSVGAPTPIGGGIASSPPSSQKQGSGSDDLFLVSEGEQSGRRLQRLCERAAQLRLLANLLTALLYMRRRSFVDALAFIHAIVTLTNAIPSARLAMAAVAATATGGTHAGGGGDVTGESGIAITTADKVGDEERLSSPLGAIGSRRGGAQQQQQRALFGISGASQPFLTANSPVAPSAGTVAPVTPVTATTTTTTGGDGLFTYFGNASEELLRAVLSSISDEEDDEDSSKRNNSAHCGMAGSSTSDAEGRSDGDDNDDDNSKEAHTLFGNVSPANGRMGGDGGPSSTGSSSPSTTPEGVATTKTVTTMTAITVTTASLDEAASRQAVAFHCFVLNVLVTVGLALEEVQPMVTRSAYALAAGRARDVLGQESDRIVHCLDGNDGSSVSDDGSSGSRYAGMPRLLSALMPELAAAMEKATTSATTSTSKDMTTFPTAFFTAMPAAVDDSGDEEADWAALPPLHLVKLFPIV